MKVSVIIPTYNRAQLVQETIESVLKQSYRDYEIIVIDDGSTDDTEQALKRFSSRIRYIRQENQGLNRARNRAIALSQGEYIALLDSDDLWRGFKLELEVSLLDAFPNSGFVFGDFYILKPDGRKLAKGLHTWFADKPAWNEIFQSFAEWDVSNIAGAGEIQRELISIYSGDIYHSSLFGPRVLPSASLFRKSMTADWLRFNEQDSFCGDWDFFARLSHQHGAVFIDLETAFNRSHEDAVRLTRSDCRLQIRKRLDMILGLWKLDDDFCCQYKSAVDGELARLIRLLLKLHLMAGDTHAAREVFAEFDRLDSGGLGSVEYLYKVLTYVPGNSYFLPKLQSLKKKLQNV